MRIIVKENGGPNIRLRLPSGLVLNRMSARLVSAELRKRNMNISAEQLHLMFRAIKAYKKAHPEWKLVEMQNQKGERIEVVM